MKIVKYLYRKQNSNLQYIRKQSNQPPSRNKRIPSMISKRLSDTTRDKEHFDKAAPIYNEALKNSCFNEPLKLSPATPTRRHRKRKIIWSNPPFSSHVKTNVAKPYLTLLQKNITCMPNMKSIIQNRHANLLSNHTTTFTARSCNCHQKSECPLHNEAYQKVLPIKLQFQKLLHK